MQRARRLLEGLRLHHLGFGFFWAVTFVVLTGFQPGHGLDGFWQCYTLAEQGLMPAAVGAFGYLCARRRCELPHWTAGAACFLLSGSALLYFLVFHLGEGTAALSAIAGLLMGIACALFFLLWELFYVTEGQQRALICIPLSAAMSVGLYLLVVLLPLAIMVFATVTILPFVALICLQKSLEEIELDTVPLLDRPALRAAVADLWRPVLCVSILAFSQKLIARVGGTGEADSLAALVGFAAAALLVVALELFLSKGFDILHIYQLLFPALTIGFLLPSLFGQQYTTLLVAFLMFGFEVVNLLLIITCAVYTIRNGLPASPLYALCIGPVLLAMLVGSEAGALLGPVLSGDVAHWASIILFCIVLLSVALVLVARGKGKAPASMTDAELTAPASPSASGDNGSASAAATADRGESGRHATEQRQVVRAYLEEQGLSPRETEVAELLMKGHSISAIAGKLFISENTTRGHAKSIYKKLAVHSRQELVDLGDQLLG